MSILHQCFLGLAILGMTLGAAGAQLKEFDSDVNYEEDRIPHYDLPPLLVDAEGHAVDTPEAWWSKRRPEILSLFANLMYGRIPTPETPLVVEKDVLEEEDDFLDGLATRTAMQLTFSNEAGEKRMTFVYFVPNGAGKPAPAIMHLTHDNPRSRAYTPRRDAPGVLRNGWPAGLLLRRGYALVGANVGELMEHNEVEFLRSIHRLYFKTGQSFPKAHEWGVLAAIGWGASRMLDHLETVDAIDQERVALFGHSMLGKSALWAAARDTRFAMAVSAQSGCGGAALWRRRSGETLKKMVTRFPYWLCRNAWKFVDQEDDLPVDQHMLLALVAPRPLYVFSAVDDAWADPRGEYLGAYHASEAYRLLGEEGLASPEQPAPGRPVGNGKVGYHLREGGHSVEQYDWERILDFADRHLGSSAD